MKLLNFKQIIIYIILIIWGFLSIYPLIWMASASVKTPMEVMGSFSLLPKDGWHWETYKDVWNRLHFFKYFLNSASVSFWTLLGVLFLYALASFAFAKLKFPGNNIIFYGFLGMMFVPGMTFLIPLYLTENSLGILDTHLGLILPMVNGAAPFAIFLFRNYFKSIPHEIFESAKIEGASIIRILLQVYLPLAVPAMATIAILNFIASWNSLLLPMVMLNNKDLFTLPLSIILLDNSAFRQWNVLMAGSLISILPVIVVFFFTQKYYVQGLTAGAVKS